MSGRGHPISRRAFATGLAAAGLSGAAARAQTSDWNAVVAAAKAEGVVTVYNTGLGLHRDVAAAFTARHGIKVEFLDMRASELRERVRIEQSARRYLADLCLNGSTGAIAMDRAGQFTPHGPLPNTPGVIEAFRGNGTRVSIFQNLFGYMINTTLVPPDREPRSYRDLLDPFFRNRILADDPRASGEGFATFAVTAERLGIEYQRALAAQNPTFTRNLLEGGMRVARGEYAVYFPQKYPDYLLLKSLPVKFVWPSEGAVYQTFMLAMLRNAPHPNAARLLLNFFLDPEAQLIYARTGRGVTVNGVLNRAPADIAAALSVARLGTADADREYEFLRLAKVVYGPA
jgi:iron(III) transport system substrate-binding protein